MKEKAAKICDPNLTRSTEMYFTITETNDIPPGHAATAKFWMVRVRPEYKDDKPLIAHEVEGHVRQFWRNPFKHSWRNTQWGRDDKYTLDCEVEAYRIQLSLIPEEGKEVNRVKFAERISTMYGLDISVEEAYKLLS